MTAGFIPKTITIIIMNGCVVLVAVVLSLDNVKMLHVFVVFVIVAVAVVVFSSMSSLA